MSPPQKPQLLTLYARNVEILACKKGWTFSKIASDTGVSINTLNGVRYKRSKTIDPELLTELMDLFKCSPNDLLQAHPDVDYSITPTS